MASISNGPTTKRQKTEKEEHGFQTIQQDASRRLQELSPSIPVLSLTSNHENAPIIDPSSSDSSLLQSFIFPLSVHDFLEHCFRKKALHISSGNHDERVQKLIQQYMYNLDSGSIIAETSSENVFVWLVKQDLIESIEISDPSTALSLHQAGHATYCRSNPTLEQLLVSRMLAETGIGCGQYDPTGERSTCMGRGEVEVFQGTCAHMTDWHYDFQENFTIQLSGSKRWTLQEGTVKYPLRGCTPHYAAPRAVESQLKAARLTCPTFEFDKPSCKSNNARGEQCSIVLKAGDSLYFPAGMWHKVETVEAGVSINISLMATNYASLTCQALQHLLLTKKGGWNETIVNNSFENARDKLGKLLTELPNIIQEFERNGGAQSILPPTLLAPPAFSLVNGTQGAEEEDEQRNGEDDNAKESDNTTDDSTTDESSHEVVVDVTDSACPEGWLPTPPGPRMSLVKNPLASLTPMKDISQYYDDNKQHDNEEDEDELYVLNVNYAGNEMHESAVRLLLRDCTNQRKLKDYADPSNHGKVYDSVPPCLVYYGLFQWRGNNRSS